MGENAMSTLSKHLSKWVLCCVEKQEDEVSDGTDRECGVQQRESEQQQKQASKNEIWVDVGVMEGAVVCDV